jgi:DNA-binding NarL/FixJ family response regulator
MKILLADDHDLFRAGLGMVLCELEADTLLLQAATLTDAIERALAEPDLDLALLDLNMPAMNGNAGLQQFRTQFPQVPVVIVSGSDDLADVQDALNNGASGFIHKSTSPSVMLSALRLVLAGGIYVPPHAMRQEPAPKPALAPAANKAWESRLTARQMEVLRLLALGKPNKVIARELDLSEGTVKIHLSAIFRVLDVNNRTEAVLAAQQLSLNLGASVPKH